jgi:holin-like protein
LSPASHVHKDIVPAAEAVMIPSLTVILLCQLLGEAIARGFGWPLPGPVLGMMFLLVVLSLRDRMGRVPSGLGGALDSTGKTLLAHLSLLLVPAGVGIVQRLDVLADHGLGLAIALLVSTFLTLLVTAVTFLAVSRMSGAAQDPRQGKDPSEEATP